MNQAGTVQLDVPERDLYGLHNLPYGVFSRAGRPRRVAVRYGQYVVDLAVLLGDPVFAQPTLNEFMSSGPAAWKATRQRIVAALDGAVPSSAIHGLADVTLHLPVAIGDYVDFYASEHHATTVGRLFRPDQPLLPNWRHLPIGYHGRAGSIAVSGTDVTRPHGQFLDPAGAPVFAPTERLDFEAELAFVVGTGNPAGSPIPVAAADRHLFGVALFNDWSARDIQAWEYVPLGPHLGKSFASTMSAWIVPLVALDAARVAVPAQDPAPLPYLTGGRAWGLAIDLEVLWNGEVVSRPPYAAMYWSPAQMLAHLTAGGAPTRPGDVFASGTVSGPAPAQRGAAIELTANGTEPIIVAGEPRGYVADGDEIVLRATAPAGPRRRLALGEVRARVLRAR